jgi:hypothetical protein
VLPERNVANTAGALVRAALRGSLA